MKKLIGLALTAFVACTIFAGCASKATETVEVPETPSVEVTTETGEIAHPRLYTFDLIDAGTTCTIPYNQYGPNYQLSIDFWKRTKADRPKVGDTVKICFKGTVDKDMPVLYAGCLADTSAAASYWTVLTSDSENNKQIATDIKADTPIEFTYTYTLVNEPKGGLSFVLVYDYAEQPAEYPKLNESVSLTFERVTDSTDTVAEKGGNSVPVGPQIYNVAIEKYAAFFEIQTNHPWINGAQDMSLISNYEGYVDITNAFGGNLPQAGDTIHVTWKASGDTNIPEIRCRLVDRSAAANWWTELSFNSAEKEPLVDYSLVTDVVKGQPFETSVDLPVAVTPEEQVVITMYYDYDAEAPIGPSIFKIVR